MNSRTVRESAALVEAELACELRQRGGFRSREHRRHEAADRLGVDQRIANLRRLLRDEPSPDRISLRPEVLALVVETLRVAIDDDAERHAVDARADAAVVQGCPRVDRHGVALRRIADRIGAGADQRFEQNAPVETGAADQEVVGGPFAGLVSPPRFAQPLAIGFEPPGGDHACARLDALGADARGDEAVAREVQRVDRRVIADVDTELPGAAVVRIDQRLATAHEERIGAREMECPGQRRLEVDAMPAHPLAAAGRFADDQRARGSRS